MRRAFARHPAGTWPVEHKVGTVTLAWADRHRRRLAMADDAGTDFLLDLAEATVLADGDGLELANGGFIAVRAADEAVVDIDCGGSDSLARLAWHIGNRHTPMQILPGGRLRILFDHVLVGMIAAQGGDIKEGHAPFHAESGAYASHGHAAPEQTPALPHGAWQRHDHGPGQHHQAAHRHHPDDHHHEQPADNGHG
jgi:urease accessory protein